MRDHNAWIRTMVRQPQSLCRGAVVVCGMLAALLSLSLVTTTTKNLWVDTNHHQGSSRGCNNDTTDRNPANVFPLWNDTLEMSILSHLIYHFHKEDYGNADIENTVCDHINARNITDIVIPKGLVCHWYHHDWTGGAQVMIVSSTDYAAVVFAGTDDLRTSLTDANLLKTEFGMPSNRSAYDDSPFPVYNVSLPPETDARVHAGFNHMVFDRNLFGEIVYRLEQIRNGKRIFTTGHSLGAANAVLTALGLVQYFERYYHPADINQQSKTQTQRLYSRTNTSTTTTTTPHIVCLNFGSPRIGNVAWRDYVHTQTTLPIWRFVLGYDLVPRLPTTLFRHAGHTVQLFHNSSHRSNSDSTLQQPQNNVDAAALTYYHHVGNKTLQRAGVPFLWDARPFVWVPGALLSHSIRRYCDFFSAWKDYGQPWIHDFVRIDDVAPGDDDRPPNVDDDFYVDPPDDDFEQEDSNMMLSSQLEVLAADRSIATKH